MRELPDVGAIVLDIWGVAKGAEGAGRRLPSKYQGAYSWVDSHVVEIRRIAEAFLGGSEAYAIKYTAEISHLPGKGTDLQIVRYIGDYVLREIYRRCEDIQRISRSARMTAKEKEAVSDMADHALRAIDRMGDIHLAIKKGVETPSATGEGTL